MEELLRSWLIWLTWLLELLVNWCMCSATPAGTFSAVESCKHFC
jgi:hypothetical protein